MLRLLLFLSELNNILIGLKIFTFNVEYFTIGERPNKKNIDPLNLTQKVNLLRLWRVNSVLGFNEIKIFHKTYFICGLNVHTILFFFPLLRALA